MIEFRGLDIMNDDPSEVKVLYIQAHDESGCLQKMSDDIADYFVDRGKIHCICHQLNSIMMCLPINVT